MASAPATFVELQQLYNFDEKIVDKIVASGVTSLSEFRFFCKDEEDVVTTFITPLGLENERLEGARLKRAWAATEGLQTFDSVMMLQGLGVPEFCLLLH